MRPRWREMEIENDGFVGYLIHPATHSALLETLQEIDSVSGLFGEYFSSSNLLYVGQSLLFCPL